MAAVVSSSRFVGRTAELHELELGLAAAIAGRAAAFLLAGEAGVGKSRLVEELLDRAEASGAVGLVGACLDVEEGRLPFGPFAEALRPHLRELGPAARRELLAPGGEELARLLPELGGDEDPMVQEPTLAQERMFELVLGLLGRLAAAAPLVLVLEDLHWSDRSTRDLLAFLTRNLRSERVLLVATYRSDELFRGHPLRPFLAELGRGRRLERLELEPFTREELDDQVSAILGAPADVELLDSIFERSQGNAFFTEELLAAGGGADELPPTLRDILLARIDQQSSAAQDLLHVAAVGGRLVSDRLLAAVSSIPEPDRLAALRALVAHQLLVPRGDSGYAFRHELLREAVYQELLPEERARLHAGYGAALSEHPELAGDAQRLAGDLAHHWFAAHDLPRALGATVHAGKSAEDRSGYAEARTHYERALELWEQVPDAEPRTGVDRVSLIRRAAETANLAGDHGRAAALIRPAIARLDERDDPVLAGVLHERLGRFLWASGDSNAALRAYEEATRLVPSAPPSAARARVLAARGQGLMLISRHEESRACCAEAIDIARSVGARAELGHALNTLGCDLAYLGQPDDAVANLREALAIAEEVQDLDDLCRAYLNLSDLFSGPLNRLEEGLALAFAGAELAERKGMAGDYGVSLQTNAAAAFLRLGCLRDAEAILLAAERRNPSEMAAIDLHQSHARLDLLRGALEGASAHLSAARNLMVKTVDPPYHAAHRAIEAEVALWRGLPAQARDSVAAGLAQLKGIVDPWLAAPLLWLGVRTQADLAAAAVGRRGEADRAAAQRAGLTLLERTRETLEHAVFVPPASGAYAAMAEAEAERLSRVRDPDAWRRSVSLWEQVGHRYPEAYARWRHAESLLARRRAREGADVLRAAHAVAGEVGAGALVREIELLAVRARIELAWKAPVADGTQHDDDGGTADAAGLTVRQREVLALIAAGRTNREIATELFITEKTAGAHVSSILARLGVRSRVEAATAAHRLGLVPVADE